MFHIDFCFIEVFIMRFIINHNFFKFSPPFGGLGGGKWYCIYGILTLIQMKGHLHLINCILTHIHLKVNLRLRLQYRFVATSTENKTFNMPKKAFIIHCTMMLF
jgi:hypothetical protein